MVSHPARLLRDRLSAMVLFVEGLWLRTGDPLYKALAERWSKVMLILFAVGVVTGTILSFEFGLLWPTFMEPFGGVFGLGFTLEGISFFLEAVFLALYLYGWDRLSPRAHWCGRPRHGGGTTASLFVITANGWMNPPIGFGSRTARSRPSRFRPVLLAPASPHQVVHMLLAALMVHRILGVASVYAVRAPARAA